MLAMRTKWFALHAAIDCCDYTPMCFRLLQRPDEGSPMLMLYGLLLGDLLA